MKVASALTKGRNWNTQYTGGPLSTLGRSLPFAFLRLALFGHVIAPDVIQPSSEYSQQRKGKQRPMRTSRKKFPLLGGKVDMGLQRKMSAFDPERTLMDCQSIKFKQEPSV